MVAVSRRLLVAGCLVATGPFASSQCEVDELVALIGKHEPALRASGLVTERPFTIMRSRDGSTFIEVFEWTSMDAATAAHSSEHVGPIWGAMAEVAEFLTLADLAEATTRFPHFAPA